MMTNDAPPDHGEVLGAGAPVHGRTRSMLAKAPPWAGVGFLVLVVAAWMSVTNDYFLTYNNLNNVMRGAAAPLLLAVGTTFLITTGMVDLSLGSLLALSTMILLGFMNLGLPTPIAVIGAVLSASLLSGLVNGVLIARFKLFFMVVTLGTMSIFRAVAQLPTEGNSVPLGRREGFGFVRWIGDGKIGPASVPVVLSLVGLVAAAGVLRYTNFGRAITAVGGNEEAARVAGIPVERVRIWAFAVNGLFIGIAAMVMSGRLQAASSSIGSGMELQVIAAVLLGGSSFMGGASTMAGTFAGVLFVSVLQNALNLMEIQVFWQGVVTGVVLIAAVALDQVRARHARSR